MKKPAKISVASLEDIRPVMAEDYRPAKGHPNKIKVKAVRKPVVSDLCQITAAESNEWLASLPTIEPL